MRLAVLIFVLAFSNIPSTTARADELFEPLLDAPGTTTTATANSQAFILYIAAETCSFCRTLDEEVMQALIRSDAYKDKVVVRRLLIEDYFNLVDFDNKTVTADEFIQRYQIRATPTLLFLGKNGEEITDRLEGYRKNTFYWTYLDRAINASQKYYKNISKN